MSEVEGKWQDLSREKRQAFIIDQLVLVEMEERDPGFTIAYCQARAGATGVDKMKTDTALFRRVVELRGEGRFSSADQLEERAENLVDCSPVELMRSLHDYSQELERRDRGNDRGRNRGGDRRRGGSRR